MESGGKPVRTFGPVLTGNVSMKRGKVSPRQTNGTMVGMTKKMPISGKPHENSNHEDVEWFAWAQTQLQQIAGQEGKISREIFRAALNIKQSFFSERFFTLSDKENMGEVDLDEFVTGLEILATGDCLLKLSFLFDAFDVDGSGSIDKDILRMLLMTCTPENSLRLSEEHLDALTNTLYSGAGKGKNGSITFDELYKQLKIYPSLVKNLTISVKTWLTKSKDTDVQEIENCTLGYIRNNMSTIIFIVLYWLLNDALAGYSIYANLQENFSIIIARACGLCLNFNCAFALVLTFRHHLTWLRNSRIGHLFPVNERAMFHTMVATFVVVMAVIHSLAHIGNIALVKQCASVIVIGCTNITNSSLVSLEYWEILITTRAATGHWGFGLAYLSGVILLVILFFVGIFSMPFIRRSGHFEIFTLAQVLYVVFLGLLVLHGCIFWMFVVGPGILFILEKLLSCTVCRRNKYYITEVNLLPSKVTKLVISRPRSFKYKSGDYVFVNIPAIASQEWHAFAISSAPELQGEFWLHVQSVGPWTSRLNDFFEKYESIEGITKSASMCHETTHTMVLETVENGMCTNHHNSNLADKAVSRKYSIAKCKTTHLKIHIDGPYGVPSHDTVFEAEHAVLITSGAGAIPFLSIIRSMVNQINNSHSQCPSCSLKWYDVEKRMTRVKKVDFIWINPDQKRYEWFISLLMDVDIELEKKKGAIRDFLEIQIFMTAASNRKDLKGIGLQMALDSLYQDDNTTASRIRTEAGRPNFDEVFTKIGVAEMGKVEVFCCGLPVLDKCVKQKCKSFGFKFSKVRF